MAVEQFTDDQLAAKLQEVLGTWPLYRRLVYLGADNAVAVPRCLKLFCPHCKLESLWQTDIARPSEYSRGEHNRRGFTQKEYKCRNCGGGPVTYYFYWDKTKDEKAWLFFKVGQYPELEERVPESLERALGADDLKTYRNALRMRNFNYGIAAVAYMRRVVENRMNDMLSVLEEAARAHNVAPEILARHEEMQEEKRFSVKVDYAGDLLPASLRPEGQPNPMAVLHDLASDALHMKSDEECVDIFDACRQTFEYVFGKLRIEAEDARTFVKGVAKLAAKRAEEGGSGGREAHALGIPRVFG